MNIVTPIDGYRKLLARINRRKRKDKLDFRRGLHCVTSSVCFNEIDRQGMARFKRKERKNKLNLKRNIQNRVSMDVQNVLFNPLCLSLGETEGSSNRTNSFRQRRRQRMEIMKLKRLRLPIPRQKPLVRRGLSSSRRRSSHSRTSDSSAQQEMFDNEVNDAIIIDIQISNCRHFQVAEMLEYKDIGDMDIQCAKCGAIVWDRETVGKSTPLNGPEVSICCMKGNIILPYMIEPPALIKNLFSGVETRSSNFISNLRCYNNMFAFTSFGGRVESRENDGRGPPNFVISGQNYHICYIFVYGIVDYQIV
ncbi:hypothetical protein QL285_047013 [Trifolium repens]|nr:hypothetical protein QL285_047013 [Trifolium repens]